jgi:hypothetical protein
MTHMHPMEVAYRNGAIRVPDDIASEICEATNSGIPTGWPEFSDPDGDVWALTGETHDGDSVMLPYASDLDPMLRRDVEREFGPLTAPRP